MPDDATLVVANGGVETHPETGRTRLNIPTMASNLSYIDLEGHVLAHLHLDQAHRKNSIRQLAVAENGQVAFAMQWQGDPHNDLPLLGVHHRESNAVTLKDDASVRRMMGYLGSVAIAADGETIAATSPRASLVQVFHNPGLISELALEDVCGVAATDAGFVVTTGTGMASPLSGGAVAHAIKWDNHLVPI